MQIFYYLLSKLFFLQYFRRKRDFVEYYHKMNINPILWIKAEYFISRYGPLNNIQYYYGSDNSFFGSHENIAALKERGLLILLPNAIPYERNKCIWITPNGEVRYAKKRKPSIQNSTLIDYIDNIQNIPLIVLPITNKVDQTYNLFIDSKDLHHLDDKAGKIRKLIIDASQLPEEFGESPQEESGDALGSIKRF
jgi:hypothetical protein